MNNYLQVKVSNCFLCYFFSLFHLNTWFAGGCLSCRTHNTFIFPACMSFSLFIEPSEIRNGMRNQLVLISVCLSCRDPTRSLCCTDMWQIILNNLWKSRRRGDHVGVGQSRQNICLEQVMSPLQMVQKGFNLIP